MTKTATFSNGHTDTYKGDRNVTAAWMLTDRETGEVLASGHSLDAEKARKTAQGNISHLHIPSIPGSKYYVPQSITWMNKGYAKELLGQLKRDGIDAKRKDGKTTIHSIYQAAKRANAQRNEAKRARVAIEVIDLT